MPLQPAPGRPNCTVDEVWSGRTVVLAVHGTVDMLTAPTLEAAIAAASEQDHSALIIDLTHVDFLASHGITVLVTARQSTPSDVTFAVVADGPVTARPLRLTGVADLLGVYPTRDAALGALVA